MPELDDQQLLREFAGSNSEAAFATLVARYVNLVYSTALRFSGNPHRAEEITQAVFIILARKAGGWRRGAILSGWLYQTARLTAANVVKGEVRRQRREQEAGVQSMLNEPEEAAWEQIAPLLDDAMGRLGETDRTAVVLRFFENKTAREVAAALKLTEAAAHKRVNRALEKLRKFFARRGITSTTAILAGTISANSIQAAPVALAKSVTVVAIAKGAAASVSTLALVKGALRIMAWTKAKTAVVASIGILFVAGTTVTVKEIQEHRTYPWQVPGFDGRVLEKQPPQVEILSSTVPYSAWGSMDNNGNPKFMGTGVRAKDIVRTAYGSWSSARTIFTVELPTGKYDYIASLPADNEAALQREVKREFGVVARPETQTADALVLELRNPDAPGLRPGQGQNPQAGSGFNSSQGQLTFHNARLSMLAGCLENCLATPVVDQTGPADEFDFDFKSNELDSQRPNLQNLREALLDQLGLELVPTNMPIEMLVVERAP